MPILMFHSNMLWFASLTQCQMTLSSSAARRKYALILQDWDELDTLQERSYRSQTFMYNTQVMCVFGRTRKLSSNKYRAPVFMVLSTIIAPSQCLLEFANIYHLNIRSRHI